MRTLWKKLLTFVLAVAEYLKVVVVDPDSSFCQLVDLAYDVMEYSCQLGFDSPALNVIFLKAFQWISCYYQEPHQTTLSIDFSSTGGRSFRLLKMGQ